MHDPSGPLETLAAYAVAHHTSTVVVSRPSGEPTFDPATGGYTDPAPTVVYNGAGLVRPQGAARTTEFGEAEVTLRVYDVELGSLTVDIRVGDDVAVSGSQDPKLNGAALVVIDVPGSDLGAVRHVVVEELV